MAQQVPQPEGRGLQGLLQGEPAHCRENTLELSLHREAGETGLQLPQDRLHTWPSWAWADMERSGSRRQTV